MASVAALIVIAMVAASPAAAAGPTVTINQASAQSDPTSGSTIQFTATFSEPVSGFTATDVDLSASTASGTLVATVGGGPAVYTVAVSGMTSAGDVVATIPAGAALDLADIPSAASTSTDNSVAWLPPIVGGGSVGGGGADQSPSNLTASPAPQAATPSPQASLRLLSSCTAKHPCATNKSGHALPLRVVCGPTAPCVGSVTIVLGHKTLGELRVHLAAAATGTLRVPLRHRATQLLEARPTVAAKLEINLGPNSTSSRLTFAPRGG